MKLSKFLSGIALSLLGVALFPTTSLFPVFCQVQESFNTTIAEPDNPGESEVAAHNPALLSTVPIIVPTNISSHSLKQSEYSSTILYPVGKPPKSGDLIQPPVHIIPSDNFTDSATINIPTTGDNMV